ncbi:MAG: 3-phosphoshikimate 1-carboxyvinyltransferase [Gammaproteobacteria bacterium]|nr:3-phosphoshikimate 1-carboxyvinyltransferase [Gammaproteobacteria bacterium]
MTSFECQPGGVVNGSIRVPGDKSISHRSIILSSIAQGSSHITGFLQGEDSLNTLRAFQAMGVSIERDEDNILVHGVGLHGLQKPEDALDMGNSGTAMRLLLGLLAGQSFDTTLCGDESLSKRPMNRVILPLQEMNAAIDSQPGGMAPLRVHARSNLKAIDYRMPIASAQVKSCLLLAALYADGETTIEEPAPSRDHTERMLRSFGCEVISNGSEIKIRGGQTLYSTGMDIPGDISSAAFFLVAASIATNSQVTLRHVGINPTRTGVIQILNLMGADISLLNQREIGGEPVADILVRSSKLKGIQIPEALVPLAIDEFPVLFIAAACASGETILTGAEELRVKESDRIEVMADGLKTLGIEVEPKPDGIIIQGGSINGGVVESHGDHRVAMALSVASLRATGVISIRDSANVNTSFPGFVELARQSGLNLSSHA